MTKLTVNEALEQGYTKAIVFNAHSEGTVLNIEEIDFTRPQQRNIMLASKQPSNPRGLSPEEIAELLSEHIDISHHDETGHELDYEIIEAIKAVDFSDVSNKIKEALSGIFFYWATDIILIQNRKQMTNFAQPVSMECTEEQYKRDLKDGLEKLGYETPYELRWDIYGHISTGFNKNNKQYGLPHSANVRHHGRHFIDHYNPSLFLAIAGMREGKDVHVGEWMIATRDSQDLRFGTFTKSTFRQKEFESQFRSPENMPSWRKATLSELINHFTKKDMIYTLDDLREGKVACVNDGTLHELRQVLWHCFPEDKEPTSGSYKYYRLRDKRDGVWMAYDEVSLPTQSVKLFHSQLPKEHEFKFGDEVIGYNEEGGHYKVMGYYVAKSSSKTRPHIIVCDEEDLEKLVTGSYAKSTLGFNYVKKRVRVVPQPKVITSSQIKEAFECDSYVIQD